ncbi:MAG: septum formation initiator family protein [bacterium]
MKKIVLYGIIIFQLLLIMSLVRGIQLSRKSDQRIESLKESKERLLAEQEKLNREKGYVQSPYYLEKVARDELHLSKPGESVVIVPDSQWEAKFDDRQMEKEPEEPNWRKWWGVLSGNL